ncbi:Uncharacterized protein KF715C_ch36570 [Pseudomonas putida]|uniref:Uncharacterized protein n=1 Tax=Pseudomonas putida TaxID=303 RepID=A0A1L7NFJ0_PSEPU|nr:Uncharacterized protein KF715C_ch36570 [Pseudomonas putida]GLO20027.1 hypothetical protein PPUJ20188_34240 [Pseudomonas putida]
MAPRRASDRVSVPMWHCRWTVFSVAEQRQIEAHGFGQVPRALDESLDFVVLRGSVQRGAFVPTAAVELQ